MSTNNIMAFIDGDIPDEWIVYRIVEKIKIFLYWNLLAGWTWIYAIDYITILIASYFTIEFSSVIAVRIINWFLLRSFPAISRAWCFVHPPHKNTQLERLQRQMKFFFYIFVVIMRWPGWKDFHLDLSQCAVRGALGFVSMNSALVLLLAFTDILIRIGHHLALLLGWTPESVPLWDHGYITEDAGHTPADPRVRRGSMMFPIPGQPLHRDIDRPPTAQRFTMIPRAVYGSAVGELYRSSDLVNSIARTSQTDIVLPVTPDPDRSASFFDNLSNGIRATVPWIRSHNSWHPPSPRAEDIHDSPDGDLNGSGQTTVGGVPWTTGSNSLLQGFDSSMTGISTEPRRRFI